MPVVAVNYVECYECGTRIPLLASSLAGKLGYPTDSSTDGIDVFFACPQCKHVAPSHIPFQREQLGIPAGKQSPDDRVPCVVLLECDQGDCRSQISILAAVEIGIPRPQVKALIRGWQFDKRVTCPAGDAQTKAGRVLKITMGI